MKSNEPSKAKKFLKVFGIILLILIVIVVAVAVGGWTYFSGMLGEMKQETIDLNEVGIDTATSDELKNYRNIALLGIDSRADDYGLGNRSDCIIIASINKTTSDVKLISVYRDTYLQVLENGTNKLDLNIKEYMTVNFDAVIATVNALGGVSINIASDELKYINDYIDATSQSSGVSSKHVTTAGTQILDGVQAVAYSRIRYTAGGDYKRAERMRIVVEAMVKKAKTLSVPKLVNVANTILPRVSTNIDKNEIIGLIPTISKINFSQSIGWPYNTKGKTMDRWYGIPVTLESNVNRRLHNTK